MDTNELNEYIENYLKQDKSNRAIMLTAPWGEGKTYYVNNQLKNHLQQKELNYVIISLYGIKDLTELNKQLFLEIKLQKLKQDKSVLSTLKTYSKTIVSGLWGIGKTILKNVAKIDLDINLKEPNWEELFNSVDLKNRLIIFDDLERTNIDLIEFMGYVNNLVEQDGIKVLIITNEQELKHYVTRKNDKGEKYTEFDDITKKYLRIKEKTISDTIIFNCDYVKAIDGVIDLFSNAKFKNMINHTSTITQKNTKQRILLLMDYLQNHNLRTLMLACQKTNDLFEKLTKDFDNEFLQNLFLGVLSFCLNGNFYKDTYWKEKGLISSELGTMQFPMFKTAYFFIKYHIFYEDYMTEMENLFKISIEQENANNDLKVLYLYYVETEEAVVKALNNIENNLKKFNTIPISEYLKLANYLISLRPIINQDKIIESCKKQMIANVETAVKKGEEIRFDFLSGIQLETKELLEEFKTFKDKLNDLAVYKSIDDVDDSQKEYNPDSFCNSAMKNRDNYMNKKGFVCRVNLDKFFLMLYKSSAKQIEYLREVFMSIYSFSNLKDHYLNDLENLEKIYSKVKEIKDDEKFDLIQKHQLRYFENNLRIILNTLKDDSED